jgi:poly(hydroxyalkanoate) depolymerase family esterase
VSRAWTLHVPESPSGTLVVMLHGCVQPASELAVGTRMNEGAAARDWAVLWPHQSPKAHELRCWNWYLPEHQKRGAGEPEMLASIIRERGFERVFICGISAGAAMATILTANYPELFAAQALHSGLPFAIAASPLAGLEAMRTADGNPIDLGVRVREAMGERARVMPTIVLHGGKDQALNPRNGTKLAQQWAVANHGGQSIPETTTARHREEGRYDATVVTYEGAAVEEWRIEPLAHAWSGGSAAVTYTDPQGPDATAAILDFFARATSSSPR